MRELYAAHVAERQRLAEEALAATGFQSLILHSGSTFRYFADDQDAPHHETPHFAHWVPLEGPRHLLQVRPGEKPRLVRWAPEDYWYEQAPLGEPFWADSFELHEVGDIDAAWELVRSKAYQAYIGDTPKKAQDKGVEKSGVNPKNLLARLDWDRAKKTPYEMACLDEAARLAALGHVAARDAFENGASELEIHQAYMRAAGCVDRDLPYESIVALDEKGAILHYTGKRKKRGGKVLLIDSGASHLGYASDITRTWTTEGVPSSFKDLVRGVDALQQELCAMVKPGLPYPDVHARAHTLIGDVLANIGVLSVSGEDAFAAGLTTPFFPHGVGHFLGLQVHDVGGHQKEPAGGVQKPPAEHPFLRTTRQIEVDQVFTIEPGVYFIPMLLRPLRAGERANLVDWDLVDELTPFGGVRIEDDLAVTETGHRNITRPYV